MLHIFDLVKKQGTSCVSLVLFSNFNKDILKLLPDVVLLNISQLRPDGSLAFPDFNDDITLSSSFIVQGGVTTLLADFSLFLNSLLCTSSISSSSGKSGLALSHCLYSSLYIFFIWVHWIMISPFLFLTPMGGHGMILGNSCFFHFHMAYVLGLLPESATWWNFCQIDSLLLQLVSLWI